jgi:hypothetical protein
MAEAGCDDLEDAFWVWRVDFVPAPPARLECTEILCKLFKNIER